MKLAALSGSLLALVIFVGITGKSLQVKPGFGLVLDCRKRAVKGLGQLIFILVAVPEGADVQAQGAAVALLGDLRLDGVQLHHVFGQDEPGPGDLVQGLGQAPLPQLEGEDGRDHPLEDELAHGQPGMERAAEIPVGETGEVDPELDVDGLVQPQADPDLLDVLRGGVIPGDDGRWVAGGDPDQDCDRLRAIRDAVPGVERVVDKIEVEPYKVLSATGRAKPKVLGVSSDYADLVKLPLGEGRFFDRHDEETFAQVCVIGDGVRRELFGFDPALGRPLKVNEQWLTVVGVFVNAAREEVHRVIATTGISLLQFHGEETPEEIAGFH